jgi:hypothetical protein
MTRPNYVDITLLIDRSCSMAPLTREVLEGVNAFVTEQKRLPLKQDVTFSLMVFDHEYRVICNAIPLRDAPRFTEAHYQPRGNTSLYDALGRCIDETGLRLRAMPEPERPSQVLFVALTDGIENTSWNYSAEKLTEMVDHQRNRYLWQFAFLGTHGDLWTEARRFGLRRDETCAWDHSPEGIRNAFDLLIERTAHYRRCGRSPIPGFFIRPGEAEEPFIPLPPPVQMEPAPQERIPSERMHVPPEPVAIARPHVVWSEPRAEISRAAHPTDRLHLDRFTADRDFHVEPVLGLARPFLSAG